MAAINDLIKWYVSTDLRATAERNIQAAMLRGDREAAQAIRDKYVADLVTLRLNGYNINSLTEESKP